MFMKRCGWLIIALFALQSIAFDALSAYRAAPGDRGQIGVNVVGEASCEGAAGADKSPFEPHAPAQHHCCFSCVAAGACGANSLSPITADAETIEWPTSRAFLTRALSVEDQFAQHAMGWSTSWSSRAPPFFS